MKQKKVLNILTMMIIDAILISLSFILSMLISEAIGYSDGFPKIKIFIVIIIAIKIGVNFLLGIYNTLNKYLDFIDISKIVLSSFFTNVLIVIYLSIPSFTKFMPRALFLPITTFEIVGLVSIRMLDRISVYLKNKSSINYKNAKRTLIIGAGSAAELAIKEINTNKNLNNYIIGLLDDDSSKIGRTISGIKVLGQISSLKTFVKEKNIEEIIMAINNYPKTKYNDLLNEMSEFNQLSLKRISLSNDLRNDQSLEIIDVKPEDLLDRYEVKLDRSEERRVGKECRS